MKTHNSKIAIVGGGIAGSSLAIYLGELGLNVTLFERKDSLVSGPPMCHLHAGGNLYREISDEQCIALLHESIDLARLYPLAIDLRPTVIAIPTYDDGECDDLLRRLALLRDEYKKVVLEDEQKKVLGEPDDYYKIYSKEQLLSLREKQSVSKPKSFDEWMIPVAKHVDLEKIKFPLVMVQEYGLNVFRLASSASLALQRLENVDVLLESKVVDLKQHDETFTLTFEKNDLLEQDEFDYIINAAGFKTGEIDDMLGYERKRLVEFKAAYVTHWDVDELWPEVIFHGTRGTPQGMAQFTPYADGNVQLHGMTEDITLFDDGLVQSTTESAQPMLSQKFLDWIYTGWGRDETKERTIRAIEQMSYFIPSFKQAQVASQPLYGAQQIPGDDATLRAVGVSFESTRYARCENVKASSVLGMGDEIVEELITLGLLDLSSKGFRDFRTNREVFDPSITEYASILCEQRAYPVAMGKRYNNAIVAV